MSEFSDQISDLKLSLTKNRAEHIGNDVWKEFVVPRFFKKNDLISDMPTRIEGGRGSGKTMILRYLSYHSQFSKNRKIIPGSALERIGLYWKADTQFLRMMQKRSIEEAEWSLIFQHYLTVKIALEIIDSIYKASKSNIVNIKFPDLENHAIAGLYDYRIESTTLNLLKESLLSKLRTTEMLTHNVSKEKVESIHFLPPTFLNHIINQFRSILEPISTSVFCVYIDEYENLLPYQQRIINTCIKGSEPPIIFNIAIKINGMSETLTTSEERLENRADYQIVNLERELQSKGFDAYLAEIFLKKIYENSPSLSSRYKLDPTLLSDPSKLDERLSDEYTCKLMDIMNVILPKRSHEDLADEIFSTPRYYRKLRSEISRALEQESGGFSVENFVDDNFKKSSVVNASLLFRKRLAKAEVKSEFEKHKIGKKSKYDAPTDWEHNNFIGSYLRIITSYKANSTFYSGFDVYVILSGGNVRHFLELCRTAFSLVSEEELSGEISINNKVQDLAAKITSEELFREISTFTPHGIRLKELVSGLGGLFQECQRRDSQSEPEIIHFGLKGDRAEITHEDQIILNEAEKWGVLKSLPSTKIKSANAISDYDYLLNPVYTPFFNITYRKNRKIEIDIEDFRGLYTSGKTYVRSVRRKIVGVDDVESEFHQNSLL